MGIFRSLERGNVAKRLGVMSTVAVVIAAGVLSLGVAQAGAVPTDDLIGTVLQSATAGGGAAQDANVSVYPQAGGPPQASTNTDPSGNYSLFVPDGTWVIAAQPPSVDTTDATTSILVTVTLGVITSGPNPPDITLQAANLSGTVTESATAGGGAAQNTNVQAAQNGFTGTFTQTDSTGHYRMFVPNGTWTVTATPPSGDTTDAATSITVTVAGGVISSGPNPPNITLQVANLTGTVTESATAGGGSAQNTNVNAQQQNSFTGFNTQTDSSGHYGLFVPDGTWVITAQPPSSDTTDATTTITVTVTSGSISSGPNPPNITLEAANLSGTVTESATAGGGAAQNTNVQAQQQNSFNGTNTQTDSSGHYRMFVPDGTWVITAQPPSSDTTDAPTTITVTVTSGAISSGPNPPDITLQTANLSGTVTKSASAGGGAAQNANVSVYTSTLQQQASTNTNMSGHYGVHVPDGNYIINAQPPFGDSTDAPTSVTVTVSGGVITSGPNPPNITLNAANLSGTVHESDGTTPAQNANVSVYPQGGGQIQETTNTDSSGNYHLFAPDGTWVVTAQPPFGDSSDSPASITVTVSGGVITSGPNPPNITLLAPNLSGTVTKSATAGGGPAQNTNVTVQQQGTFNQSFTNTDSSGHYGIHVGDGTWVITAQPPSGDSTDASTSITVTVSGGVITSGPNPPNITLHAANLSGTVTKSATTGGGPAQNTSVFAAGTRFAQPGWHQHRHERPLRLVRARRDLGHQRPAAQR